MSIPPMKWCRGRGGPSLYLRRRTPFGFAFGLRDLLFASEARAPGSASSYTLTRGGESPSDEWCRLTHQGAPCWAVVTADGRFGYTGNVRFHLGIPQSRPRLGRFYSTPNGGARWSARAQRHRGEPNSRYLYHSARAACRRFTRSAFRTMAASRHSGRGRLACGTRGLARSNTHGGTDMTKRRSILVSVAVVAGRVAV